MKKLSFLVLCVLVFFVSKSQSDNGSPKKVKPFKANIKTIDNKTIKATLKAINDSQLVVANSMGRQWAIPAENIQSFSLKRKNSMGRGAMIGLEMDKFLVVGAMSGAIIGGISGALAKKKFIIDGRKEAFCDLQPEIMNKLVSK